MFVHSANECWWNMYHMWGSELGVKDYRHSKAENSSPAVWWLRYIGPCSFPLWACPQSLASSAKLYLSVPPGFLETRNFILLHPPDGATLEVIHLLCRWAQGDRKLAIHQHGMLLHHCSSWCKAVDKRCLPAMVSLASLRPHGLQVWPHDWWRSHGDTFMPKQVRNGYVFSKEPFTSWIKRILRPCKIMEPQDGRTHWPTTDIQVRQEINHSSSWEICMQVKKQQSELNKEQQTGSKSGKEYVKAIYCHSAYITYMQSTSWEMLDWMKYELESSLPGEISITSDMQMKPHLWQKRRRTKEPLNESERGEWKSWLKTQHSEN